MLERNLELKKRYVECFEWEDSPYTALLDDFEPFMTTTEVAEVFDTVQPVLTELVREAPEIDASFLHEHYPEDLQREFGQRVAETVGFTEGAWRIDPTAHPFCISFSTRDIRLTTHYERNRPALALVDAARGGPRPVRARDLEDARTDAARERALLGLNESQSRTWENLVGRSRPFWTHWYEPLRATFPDQLGSVGLDDFVAAINRAEPG